MNYFKRGIKKFKILDKGQKGYVIAASLIIVIMCWAFISAGIITGSFNRAQIKNSSESKKINANGIIITETKNGTKYFEIYGEDGNYNNQDKIATLNNPVGNFYKNNEVSMSFQSSKGTYDEKTRVITLFENSYIVLKDGTSLEADNIVWSGSDKDTVATGHIRIKRNSDLLSTADKCIIRAGYESFKTIGNTQTKIFGKDKERK